MADIATVTAKIDADLKQNAEQVLSRVGITPANVIRMLYRQIVTMQDVPFELRTAYAPPAALGKLTPEQLDRELQKSYDSIKADRTYTADEVDAELAEEFGI